MDGDVGTPNGGDGGGTGTPSGNTGNQDNRKMVPESDLLAVKSKSEGLTTELAASKKNQDDTYQLLLGERASKEALTLQVGNLQTSSSDFERIKGELDVSRKTGEELTSKLLDSHRQRLATEYNISVEVLAGKTQQELDTAEEVLKVNGTRRGSGIDNGGGGGASAPKTSFDKMKSGLAARRK